MEEDLTETKRLQERIEEHTLAHTRITKERLKESYKNKEDWIIPVEECLSLGIIDKII
jgi:ATP-dependent protease ClpP protease subunit